jgi:phosphoribosylformimino-5-aminoimidazole carboxamide ribonucleotide (ProFAR) isomerase
VTRGWTRTLSRTVLDAIEQLNDIPLGGVLVTAVHREGQLAGTDLFLMEDVAELSVHPVIASGGISSAADLRELSDRGIAAAVVGTALYTGALDARAIAEEFAA